MRSAFEATDIEIGDDGLRRYAGLPPNLISLLVDAVERHPDRTALVELGGGRMTYAELWDRACRVAGGLAARGVRPGDRVAIRLPNGNDWALAWWGTLLAGAVVVPVNTRLSEPEVAYVVVDSGASCVIEPEEPLPDGEPLAVTDQPGDALAAICYTSGTTGFPKGAMTSHANYVVNVEGCLRCWQLDRSDHLSTLIAVPLFHVTGCLGQLLTMTAVAGTAVIMPTFDVTAFLQTIQTERISLVISVPAILWLALQQPMFRDLDVSSVRAVIYGGAPIAPALVHQLRGAFPSAQLSNGFGLTECTGLATFLPHQLTAEHADSVGLPTPVMELRLVDSDPVTGVGELLLRGPNVCLGYWNKPEQTMETFGDGWLRTGDLARIDDDGLVYIVDRKKDMINRGGENVYSVQVENALAAHPCVGEVAVVGVPDSMMGEKVGAVLVPRPGMTLDRWEVMEFAAAQLADFEVPEYLVIQDLPLPRNPAGKVTKAVLRDSAGWLPAPRHGGAPASATGRPEKAHPRV